MDPAGRSEPPSSYGCVCGKQFPTYRGLRTHSGRKRCREWDAEDRPRQRLRQAGGCLAPVDPVGGLEHSNDFAHSPASAVHSANEASAETVADTSAMPDQAFLLHLRRSIELDGPLVSSFRFLAYQADHEQIHSGDLSGSSLNVAEVTLRCCSFGFVAFPPCHASC